MKLMEFTTRKSLCKEHDFVFEKKKLLGRIRDGKFEHKDSFNPHITKIARNLECFLLKKGIH